MADTNVSGSSTSIATQPGASVPMGHETAPSASPASEGGVPWGELGQIGPHGNPAGDQGFISSNASESSGVPTVSNTSYEGLSSGPPGTNMHTPYDTYKHAGRQG
jgi:hypothetical protein